MRGELVVKIAVLAERFPPSLTWYVDTILQLMDAGGEEVGDDVWHHTVHLMSNSAAMRARGAEVLVARLEGGSYSVPLISTAGYACSCWPRVPRDTACVNGFPHCILRSSGHYCAPGVGLACASCCTVASSLTQVLQQRLHTLLAQFEAGRSATLVCMQVCAVRVCR